MGDPLWVAFLLKVMLKSLNFDLMGLFENWGGGTPKIISEETVASGKPEHAETGFSCRRTW
jgi:hypothetical protein